MKWYAVACAVQLLGLVGMANAFAQAPGSLPPQPSPAALLPSQSDPPDGSVSRGDRFATPSPRTPDPLWSIDALLGLPTAVRAQRLLGGTERLGWGVEGLLGFEFIFPMVGAGVRACWCPLGSDRDALLLSPGVDAFFAYNPLHGPNSGFFSGGPETFGFFAADVDAMCRHTFKNCLEGQLGFELGAGFSSAGWFQPVPVISLLIGCRY